MTFEQAVRKLATEDGVGMLLDIPGVWECVSEHYNNYAMRLMDEENEESEKS